MHRNFWIILSMLGVAVAGTGPAGAQSTPAGPEICYVVADGTEDAKDHKAPDLLTSVVRADLDPATNETSIGTGTGTFNVEAIALQPGTGVLFAADAGTMGVIDIVTGVFAALGPIGSGSGDAGDVEFDDVDGLSFDPATGFLYGTQREPRDEDLLLRIDPVTGAAVAGAFSGDDYVVVPEVADLADIDDIAIDPVDGTMYAVANDNGHRDRLVTIDKATGDSTEIGILEAEDVEGLGFASGQLIGTTGKNFNQEGIWDIDKLTGAGSNRRALDNAADYEGFDCLNPPTAPPPVPPVAACLVIMEDAVPDDAVDFPFTSTGGLPAPDLVLDDDADATLPNMRTMCDLTPGSYTVTQQTPPDWPLINLTCTDPTMDSATNLAGGVASPVLAPAETVTCVFQNSPATVLGEQEIRPAPALPIVTEPPAAPAAAPAAELPRTGSDENRPLMLLSGLALTAGGFGVIGGTTRRRRRLG